MRSTRGIGRTLRGATAILTAGLLIAACGGSSATPGPLPSATAVPATQPATSTGVATPAATSAAPSAAPATPVTATPAETAPSTPAATEPAPTPTPAPTAAPTKGPAAGKLASTGDKSLTGTITVTSIACQLPTPAGLQIFVLGSFGTNRPALNMHITAGSLAITISTGSGAAYHSRDFSGTGMTGFDAATGVQIDSSLTDVTQPGGNTAGIATLKSISGSIDCGNQEPGTSTLVLTATTPDGAIDGPLDPVRVGCNASKQYGLSAQTVGVGMLGTTKVTVIVNATATGFTVFLAGAANQYFFTSTDKTAASITPTGAQISGDAATNASGGGPALTVHVAGAVVCGTSTSGA